jgi:type II secretory pathway pseudopilin PulG
MDKLNRVFIIVLTTVGLVTAGLQIPAIQEQRGIVADQQAVSDLQDIKTAMTTYFSEKDDLPTSLSALTFTGTTKNRLSRYEYKAGNGSSYELCATFKTETKSSTSTSSSASTELSYTSLYDVFSTHKKGRQCFTQTAGFDYGYDNLNYPDLNSNSSTINLGGAAKDTEIQTDINALQAYLEAYYASSGAYPTLAELQNAGWRSTNMAGLQSDAVEGPNGETIGDGYDYAPGPAGCQTDCASYTLSAKYSDGTAYTKYSF